MWNIPRGGPHIGSMHEIILARRDIGAKFVTDFIIYAILTCIIVNANSTYHFRLLKYLQNLDNIRNYNLCAFLVKCLNDTIIKWRTDKNKFYIGPLLFLMASATSNIISLYTY